MAEEIDDNEFFQQDFTTASEWEIFNARLEEVFHEWKLPYEECGKPLQPNELYLTEWEVKSEIIFFADVELIVERHRATLPPPEIPEDTLLEKSKICQSHIDLMSLNNNFSIYDNSSNKIHPLAEWYGLRDFVIIKPTGNPIINESQFRVLLSSACITVAESNTEIPVFIQIMSHHLNVYLGVCENPSLRVNFDIIALESIPPTCKYLSGLLCMFKGKIKVHYVEPVTVSVRLSYKLSDFVHTTYIPENKIPFSNESDDEIDDAENQFFALPYGISIDPISSLVLNCTWPQISENVIVDSPTYSDLDPMLAPIWSVRANFKQQPIYYLTDACAEYLKLSENDKTLGSIVGSSYDFNQYLEGGPLDLLTESKIPSITAVVGAGGSKSSGTIPKPLKTPKNDGPLKEEELMQMLYYMFPDAQASASHPYDFANNEEFDPYRIKSAVPDSLVFRLSMLLATCNSYFGGISAVAYLWAEFTQEMRYRVERCIQIPGLATGFPDSRTCLLHQKLQMLNVCMERRRIREGGLPFAMTQSKTRQEDSEDEFYDCGTDEEHDSLHAAWNKPEGRLSRIGEQKLIDSYEFLYIPITQEPVPKTEDQLEDDAEVMLKLGPGSELCAQMMSASLLSDMESFKAANPNGKLEDFIRWYSPRDWIEEPDENGVIKGRLSQRMLIPENTWQTVWKTAKPVPARRQKRLFDDTKEAEKVLHYFETRTIGQICKLTIAPLIHAAILKIKDELSMSDFEEHFNEQIEKVILNLCKLSRENWTTTNQNTTPIAPASAKKWEALLQEASNLERLNIQSISLVRKLFGTPEKLDKQKIKIILTLLKGFEAELDGGAKNEISKRILNMFTDAKLSKNDFTVETDSSNQLYLPEPCRKEYTLRVSGKTVNKGLGGPQFLRAVLDKHLRLCGAFSENTIFL